MNELSSIPKWTLGVVVMVVLVFTKVILSAVVKSLVVNEKRARVATPCGKSIREHATMAMCVYLSPVIFCGI